MIKHHAHDVRRNITKSFIVFRNLSENIKTSWDTEIFQNSQIKNSSDWNFTIFKIIRICVILHGLQMELVRRLYLIAYHW